MNWIDLIIGLLLVYAFYNGFKNGLILELTALLALVLGVIALIITRILPLNI